MYRSPIILLLFLSACASVDLAAIDTHGLCREYRANQPLSTEKRVGMGVATLGFSELALLFDDSEEDLTEVEREMKKRGISDCSAAGQAQFECQAIHRETVSSAYQSCVTTNTNAIIARIQSEEAKKKSGCCCHRCRK